MPDINDKVDLLAKQLIAPKAHKHSFEVDIKTPDDTHYQGSFTVHRPTIGEKIRVGIIEARLREQLDGVDVFTNNLIHMVSTLLVIVDSHPGWWIPGQLYDYEVLEKVYMEYVDWVNQFFRRVSGGDQGDKASSTSGNDLDVDENDGARDVTGRPSDDSTSDRSGPVESD